MIRFICGCMSKIEPPISEDVFATFDSVAYDDEGFIICQIHHARRVGWRSVPYQATKQPRVRLLADEKGEEPTPAIEIEVSNYTPLELERLLIFGEIAKEKTANFKSSAEDHRDNRDPQEIGLGLHIGQGNMPMSMKIRTASFPGAPLLNADGERLLDSVRDSVLTSIDPTFLLAYQRDLASKNGTAYLKR